ncbi:MAG: thiamine pyrophosphate-dependent enzyme [Acidobacteriota bacterium]|nr:thiamine pyrophosphate-dependent enzyme [Acidobacteriota bacterium]
MVHPTAEGDPADGAHLLLQADPARVLEGLIQRAGRGPGSHQRWGARIDRFDREVWRFFEQTLDADAAFGEAIAVRTVVRHLPDDALLALANSLPIREVDLFCPPSMAQAPVLHQRGAHGIDGLVAAAAGAGWAGGRPVVLLCGDLALLHDLGGLAAARRSRAPLAIVVLANGGRTPLRSSARLPPRGPGRALRRPLHRRADPGSRVPGPGLRHSLPVLQRRPRAGPQPAGGGGPGGLHPDRGAGGRRRRPDHRGGHRGPPPPAHRLAP